MNDDVLERELRHITELARLTLKTVDDSTIARACEMVTECLGVERAEFFDSESAASQAADSGDSVAIVPVSTDHGSYGALAAYARPPRTFHDSDIELMSSLANILAAGIDRDVARRELASSRQEAQHIAGMGRLAATAAHNFNNVLMGIAPFVEVMRRGKNLDVSLDHIGRAVARGRRITQDILRYTQPSQPSCTTVEIGPWLQDMAAEARSLLTPSSTLDVKTADERLHVDGDPVQLRQIFTNLILNARDAMPNGGTVTLGVRREEQNARLPFVLDRPERFAHFTVRDTGCGMNEEMLRHAFEPLFTTKRNGNGLGLPVALQIVQHHGGEMFVESQPGAGTTFHIFLPLAQTSSAATPARAA